MSKRFAGQEFHIGLDSAILIGHPAALSASLVLIPIVIVLAIILPGNRFLPFADLAIFPFLFAMMAPLTRGNVGRMIIIGTVFSIFSLYIGSWMVHYITGAAPQAGFAIPEGAAQTSAVGNSWAIWTFLMLWSATVSQFFGWIVVVTFLAATVVAALLHKRNKKSLNVVTGAPAEAKLEPSVGFTG
jgi:PTS system galactitol-specific IIC component